MNNAEGKKQDSFGKNWNDKLRLLDAIDSLREPKESPIINMPAPMELELDSAKLREKLHAYEQTCAMLEKEVQVLEQQTLAALAEAGRLRRELDRTEEANRRNQQCNISRELLERRIADSETERQLLLDALENSEAELARMVKTLDVVVRKLQVA